MRLTLDFSKEGTRSRDRSWRAPCEGASARSWRPAASAPQRPSDRFQSGSCSISTIRSTPIMTSMASSPSSYSMATAASSCQAAQGQRNPRPPASPRAGDPEQLAGHLDPDPRRQPLLWSRRHRLVPGERHRLHSRRRLDLDLAPAHRDFGSRHQSALRGRGRKRQDAALQGIR